MKKVKIGWLIIGAILVGCANNKSRLQNREYQLGDSFYFLTKGDTIPSDYYKFHRDADSAFHHWRNAIRLNIDK